MFLKQKKIYIVEDSTEIRNRIIAILSIMKDITVVGISGGEKEALEDIKVKDPDIVILDIRLENGTGINLLKKIKESKKDAKVIMHTNYPYPQYRDRCMELGADFFLDKSIDGDVLFEIIRSITETGTVTTKNLPFEGSPVSVARQ